MGWVLLGLVALFFAVCLTFDLRRRGQRRRIVNSDFGRLSESQATAEVHWHG